MFVPLRTHGTGGSVGVGVGVGVGVEIVNLLCPTKSYSKFVISKNAATIV